MPSVPTLNLTVAVIAEICETWLFGMDYLFTEGISKPDLFRIVLGLIYLFNLHPPVSSSLLYRMLLSLTPLESPEVSRGRRRNQT